MVLVFALVWPQIMLSIWLSAFVPNAAIPIMANDRERAALQARAERMQK